MKTQTVCVGTCFSASVDVVWEKLQRIDTLQYIAAPYATFKPVGNTTLVWGEGNILKFHLKLFGFISFGIHTICVKQFDKTALVIFTNESNKFVPIWNHRIVLQKTNNDGMINYSDEVEIYAGWKTPIVVLWCKLFYKHRQKKWLKLLP